MSEAIPTQTPLTVPTSPPPAYKPVPANSVGTEQLINEAVTGVKIANGTITGIDIANGTIEEANIKNEAISETKIAKSIIEKINPGAWTEIEELNAKLEVNAGVQTLRVRIEDGSNVRLRGAVATKGIEEIAANATLFKIPAAMRPPGNVICSMAGSNLGVTVPLSLSIENNGKVTINTLLGGAGGAAKLRFDGITWNLT